MDDSKARTPRLAGGMGGGGKDAPSATEGPAQMGNALETLRVVSTLFVVFYHAGLSYVATPLRLTLWIAFERSGHLAFDGLIYWVNGFVMPVFFLAAGVSAPAACESRGARTFLSQRAHRLLRPLVFGCLTILPVFYLLWGYGLMVTGRADLDGILDWRFSPEVRHNLYGLGHLWFLEYLFLVCVLWCGGWLLWTRLFGVAKGSDDDGRGPRRLLASPWSPLLLAVPTAAIFLIDSDTMLRVDNVIVPNGFRLLHYLVFFTVGGWIAKVRDPRRQFARFGPLYLTLSFVVFALLWPLLIRHAAAPLEGWSRVGFCVLAALFPWLIIFGGLGVFLGAIRGRGPVLRFLTETSFWVYLIHVPIVALMQVVLLPTAWPVVVKFAIVSTVALGLSFASYGPLVRHSLIGLILNGARKRLPKTARFGPEFGWMATLGVLFLFCGGIAWSSRVYLVGHNLHAEVPGNLYRSARLKPKVLDALIQREGLRSVLAFTGSGDLHSWFVAQRKVCQDRRVELHSIALRGQKFPSRQVLIQLLDTLEQCPRPILVEGYRGTDQVGFASAMAQLLGGSPPEVALRQFDLRYGQFSGAEHSPLGRTLLDYRDWLTAHQWPHTTNRLRVWVRDVYVVRSEAGASPNLDVAQGASRPSAVR